MDLKIKKLSKDAIMPLNLYGTDACMDLFSIEDGVIEPTKRLLVHTGIAIALPKDTEAQIRPRSGLAYKHGVTVLNSPGTIDEDYRGEIGVILINHGDKNFIFHKGDRIAQMIIKRTMKINLVEVSELDETKRGSGGFGSTGN